MTPVATALLPTSIARETKNVIFRGGIPWVPIFCANCGKDGGLVPEETKQFAFYLCLPCADKWSPQVDTMMVPDEVFWEEVKQAQLERMGREMTALEVMEALKDPNHFLSKLAKDRYSR